VHLRFYAILADPMPHSQNKGWIIAETVGGRTAGMKMKAFMGIKRHIGIFFPDLLTQILCRQL
jgi:hypothetical protein